MRFIATMRNEAGSSRANNAHKHAIAAGVACLCITCLVTLPSIASHAIGQQSKETFGAIQSQIVAGLGKLESDYDHIRGKGIYSLQNLRGGITRVHDVEFAVDGNNRRLIETVTKYTGKDASRWLGMTYAKVIGPESTFQLSRKPNLLILA